LVLYLYRTPTTTGPETENKRPQECWILHTPTPWSRAEADKSQAGHEWSEENLEFAIKAFGRANSMRFLRLIKETDMEIIPVAEYEDMDDIEADCEESEKRRGRVLDVYG